MHLDPSITPILVALITAAGAVIVQRSIAASKRRDTELATAAAEQVERDAQWESVKESRRIALEDLAHTRARADFAESHLAVCIVALRLAGLEIPSPPHPRT